jgi:2-haloacid dehalogenase
MQENAGMSTRPYVSPSTGTQIRAVLFDVFGTVVDWRTGIIKDVGTFAAAHGLNLNEEQFADDWRGLYQPAMETVRSGSRGYTYLDVLHRENLVRVLEDHGVDTQALTGDDVERLNRAWHRLPAWPDSVSGLTAIRRTYIVGPLSNGNTSLLLDMAKRAGLPWDVIIGSDLTRAYKPAPAAYLRTAEILGVAAGELMLAAAHNTDLDAAQHAGLATAFVCRPTEHGPAQVSDLAPTGSWDILATSIDDLAVQLSCQR